MHQNSWTWIVAAVGLLAAVGVGMGFHLWSESSPRARAEAQRDELRAVREELDRCLEELEQTIEWFWEHERHTSELRSRVETLESLDPEGVPMEVYEEYLGVFDDYNEAIPEWSARADSVRYREQRCEELADRHNEMSSEFRRFLSTEGLLEGS